MRESIYTTKDGIVFFNPTKCTSWVGYFNEKHFNSLICPLPTLVTDSIIKSKGYCVLSDCKKNKCKTVTERFLPFMTFT